jgi:hypothetical protein
MYRRRSRAGKEKNKPRGEKIQIQHKSMLDHGMLTLTITLYHVISKSYQPVKTALIVWEILSEKPYHNRKNIKTMIQFNLQEVLENWDYTWIQEESSGDKSFFTLSRMIPYIFSTYAISCCLNSKAGYLASTWRTMSIGLTERLAEERKPWETTLMSI